MSASLSTLALLLALAWISMSPAGTLLASSTLWYTPTPSPHGPADPNLGFPQGGGLTSSLGDAAGFAQVTHSLTSGAGPAGGTPFSCQGTTSTAALCGSLRTPRPAALSASWINETPNLANTSRVPPRGSDSSLVWDLAGGYYVLFGGCLATQCPTNQTWLYYAGSWVNASGTLPTAPSPRSDAAMSWDANLRAIVLFGGCASAACPVGDTWMFNGTWTNITSTACPSGCPNPSYGASLGWDLADNATILFGGCTASTVTGCSATGNQTAELSTPGRWSILTYPKAPGPRVFAASFRMYVYGGAHPCGFLSMCDSSDFWEFQSVTSGWLNLSPSTGGNPGGREQAALGIEWSSQYLFLTGGYNDTTGAVVNDTWSFHCLGLVCYWQNVTAGSHMPYRYAMAYSPDQSSHTMWFEGGYDQGFHPRSDQWSYGIPPSRLVLTAQPSPTEPGKIVYLNSSTTGGSPPYNASWSFPEVGVVRIGQGTNWTTGFPRVGTFHVDLTIQDRLGMLITAAQAVTIVPPPEFNISGPSTGDVSIPMSFSALATIGKGLPAYQYAWSWGDGESGSGSAPQHAYALPGSYAVNVTQIDRVGGRATQSVTVLVHASPEVSATASANRIDLGMTIAFTASGSLGTTPYTFLWAFGDGGSGSTARTNHTYIAPGTLLVTATIADAAGASSNTTLLVSVNAALEGRAQANRTSVIVGELVHFDASASGGEPPYTYGWSFGASGQATGVPLDHAFSSPGAYPVAVTIRDSFGQSVVRTLTVNVTAALPPSGGTASHSSAGGLTLTSPVVLGGLAVAVAAVALAATLMVLRRRKKPPAIPDDEVSQPAAAPAPDASLPTS